MDKKSEEFRTVINIMTGKRFDTPLKTATIIMMWKMKTGDTITPRQWRKIKDEFNDLYRSGEIESYICGFPTGYVMTNDNDKIKKDMRNKRRQALALLMRNSDTKTAMMLQHNFKADFEG